MFPLVPANYSRTAICLVTLAFAIGFSQQSFAPIHGGFESINELIAESEVIVVATVFDKLSEGDIGGSAYYKIYRERVLKGNLDEEKLTVYMRQLDVLTKAQEASKHIPFDDSLSFRPQARYVLFLTGTKGDEKARYTNVNSSGSSFEVSPWFKLESLDGKSLKESLKLLLLDFRDFQRARMKHVEERTELLLREL